MLPASNYSQIPNVILDRLHELQNCEIRVIFLVCRQTIGFHQKDFEMPLSYIQEKTGLARASVTKALKNLLAKGWLTRRKSQTSYKYAISIDSASSSENEPVQKLASSKSEPELVQKVNSEGEIVVQKMNHTLNKYDLKKEFKEKDPLTPQGGDGVCCSQNLQLEAVGDQQARLPAQQAEKVGDEPLGGNAPAARAKKKRRTRQEIADQALGGLDADRQEAFRNFWKWYEDKICKPTGREDPGSYPETAIAWRELIDSDYRGRGHAAFREGCTRFLLRVKASGGKMVGIPDAERFLNPKGRASAKWEDALDRGKHGGNADAFLPPSAPDRGHSPPIVTAADFAFPDASPPPAHIKEQIRRMRGAAACA